MAPSLWDCRSAAGIPGALRPRFCRLHARTGPRRNTACSKCESCKLIRVVGSHGRLALAVGTCRFVICVHGAYVASFGAVSVISRFLGLRLVGMSYILLGRLSNVCVFWIS